MNNLIYERLPDSSLYLIGYIVLIGGTKVGEVLKVKGFSYWGTQGWNRGIRITDFSPTSWRSITLERHGCTHSTRKAATQYLVKGVDKC
jgi:hypothetical protein